LRTVSHELYIRFSFRPVAAVLPVVTVMSDVKVEPSEGGEKLSKNEQKRRQKAAQKAAEKEKKAAENAEKNKASSGGDKQQANSNNKINEEEISPNEYFKLRSAAVEELKSQPETHPYPHKYHVSVSLQEFIEKYQSCPEGQTREDVSVNVAGRIHAIRESGAKLIFYDLRGEGVKLQVMANAKVYLDEKSFAEDVGKIRRGDVIGVEVIKCLNYGI